jgi:BED zinc finger
MSNFQYNEDNFLNESSYLYISDSEAYEENLNNFNNEANFNSEANFSNETNFNSEANFSNETNFNNEVNFNNETNEEYKEYEENEENSDTISNTSFEPIKINNKRKYTKGRKSSNIWEYVNKGESLGSEHYKASCKWCQKEWSRGKSQDMKIHLARECQLISDEIKSFWRDQLALNLNNKKNKNQPSITEHFQANNPISLSRTQLLDDAILKAWICCGFPFHTIENPFIIDLFKIAVPGYTLPSRRILSDRLLESEIA